MGRAELVPRGRRRAPRHPRARGAVRHHAVRQAPGVGARTPWSFLERICANRIDRAGRHDRLHVDAHATGGIRCDLTVTRLAEERFQVVTGGGCGHARPCVAARAGPAGRAGVDRRPDADAFCLGLWGPRARDVLARVTDADVSNEAFPYMSARAINVGEVPVFAQRISTRASSVGAVRAHGDGRAAAGICCGRRAGRTAWSRRGGRVRLAAPGEGLPPVGPGHQHRTRPIPGGHRVRGLGQKRGRRTTIPAFILRWRPGRTSGKTNRYPSRKSMLDDVAHLSLDEVPIVSSDPVSAVASPGRGGIRRGPVNPVRPASVVTGRRVHLTLTRSGRRDRVREVRSPGLPCSSAIAPHAFNRSRPSGPTAARRATWPR